MWARGGYQAAALDAGQVDGIAARDIRIVQGYRVQCREGIQPERGRKPKAQYIAHRA